MSPDEIGRLLGITDAVREAAEAYTLGTYGGSPEARAEAAQKRDRTRKTIERRTAGIIPRDQWEAKSVSRQKPWLAEGNLTGLLVSPETSRVRQVCPSPVSETGVSETGVSEPNKGP